MIVIAKSLREKFWCSCECSHISKVSHLPKIFDKAAWQFPGQFLENLDPFLVQLDIQASEMFACTLTGK